MDLMSIRRGVMMGMANCTNFATGTIEPTENVNDVSINIGFPCKALVIAVTDKTLVSGSRQIISLSWVNDSGYVYQTSVCSNLYGTTIAGISYYTEDQQPITQGVIISGNSATVNASTLYSDSKFMAGKTYRWFAFA